MHSEQTGVIIKWAYVRKNMKVLWDLVWDKHNKQG